MQNKEKIPKFLIMTFVFLFCFVVVKKLDTKKHNLNLKIEEDQQKKTKCNYWSLDGVG